MRTKTSPKKEVAKGATTATSVNPGGPNTPKVNAKPRNRKFLRKLDPAEALAQLSLEIEKLKCEHLSKVASLRLLKRQVRALLKEVLNVR
ncbi:MAG: hypothetical protein RL095_1333 [Verrucomicrobiota bacterium]|jgi:hypothetical protein